MRLMFHDRFSFVSRSRIEDNDADYMSWNVCGREELSQSSPRSGRTRIADRFIGGIRVRGSLGVRETDG